MYELIHRCDHPISPITYQQWLDALEIESYRFDRRIFVAFKADSLAAMQADLIEFRGYYPNYFEDASFVPAKWFGDLIKLTKHYPLAHGALNEAIRGDTSVEVFARDLAMGFCSEWQRIKELAQHSGSVKLPAQIAVDPSTKDELSRHYLHTTASPDDSQFKNMSLYLAFPTWHDDRTSMARSILKAIDSVLAQNFEPVEVPGLGIWHLDPGGNWTVKFEDRKFYVYALSATRPEFTKLQNALNQIVNQEL